MGRSAEDKKLEKRSLMSDVIMTMASTAISKSRGGMKEIGSIEDLTRSELTTEAVGMSSILISRQSI